MNETATTPAPTAAPAPVDASRTPVTDKLLPMLEDLLTKLADDPADAVEEAHMPAVRREFAAVITDPPNMRLRSTVDGEGDAAAWKRIVRAALAQHTVALDVLAVLLLHAEEECRSVLMSADIDVVAKRRLSFAEAAAQDPASVTPTQPVEQAPEEPEPAPEGEDEDTPPAAA